MHILVPELDPYTTIGHGDSYQKWIRNNSGRIGSARSLEECSLICNLPLGVLSLVYCPWKSSPLLHFGHDIERYWHSLENCLNGVFEAKKHQGHNLSWWIFSSICSLLWPSDPSNAFTETRRFLRVATVTYVSSLTSKIFLYRSQGDPGFILD